MTINNERSCVISVVLSDVGSEGVKPLYLIKTYRAGYQTVPRNLKQNKLWNFLRPLIATVLEPPFES